MKRFVNCLIVAILLASAIGVVNLIADDDPPPTTTTITPLPPVPPELP